MEFPAQRALGLVGVCLFCFSYWAFLGLRVPDVLMPLSLLSLHQSFKAWGMEWDEVSMYRLSRCQHLGNINTALFWSVIVLILWTLFLYGKSFLMYSVI